MYRLSDRSVPILIVLCAPVAALILCTVGTHPVRGDCQWQTLPNAPQAGRVDDIFFIDADTGWCVNSSGQIYHTDDGGETWALQFQTTHYLRAIAFVNPMRGWAGVLDPLPRMYQTFDGGATWVGGVALPSGSPTRICGMAAIGDSTLVGVGAFDGPARYVRTDNAGAGWTAHDLSAQASTLVDAYFFDSQNGLLVGGAGGEYPDSSRSVILHTVDGGTTWTPRFTGSVAGEWCWKIFFLTDQIGFVSVESETAARVLKTIDGGINWQEYDVPGNSDIQGVGFVDENLGWVGGWELSMESNDGGSSWSTVNWGTLLNRFVRVSPTLAYASGTTVYKWSCIPTAVLGPSAPAPTASALALRCQPNPFNASTTISFDVPGASHVRVRIYDALGKQVRDLLDTELPAGPHSVEWDGRNASGTTVASGVYLYRVDASGTAESRSMVLVK